jgi:hypothetical protein
MGGLLIDVCGGEKRGKRERFFLDANHHLPPNLRRSFVRFFVFTLTAVSSFLPPFPPVRPFRPSR